MGSEDWKARSPRHTVRANYFRGWRALGGHLTLSGSDLSFEPHGLERSLGGDVTYRAPVREITEVSVRRGGMVPRKRLHVGTRDGATGVFLVPRAQAFADVLRGAVDEQGGAYGDLVPVTAVSSTPSGAPGLFRGWKLAAAVAIALFMAFGGIVSVVRAQSPIGVVWNGAFLVAIGSFLWVAWLGPALASMRDRQP